MTNLPKARSQRNATVATVPAGVAPPQPLNTPSTPAMATRTAVVSTRAHYKISTSTARPTQQPSATTTVAVRESSSKLREYLDHRQLYRRNWDGIFATICSKTRSWVAPSMVGRVPIPEVLLEMAGGLGKKAKDPSILLHANKLFPELPPRMADAR